MTTTQSTAWALKARDITASLRRTWPDAVMAVSGQPDGTCVVRMDALPARYLGLGWAEDITANRLGWNLRRPVLVDTREWSRGGTGREKCTFTVAPDPRPDAPLPADPGGSGAVPAYATVAQVMGPFPHNQTVTRLVQLAITAGCRPHLAADRSGHGRQYRVLLWHWDGRLLHGCIDAYEGRGGFAAAYLQWGDGPERRYDRPAGVTVQLTSCRDLNDGRPAVAGRRWAS